MRENNSRSLSRHISNVSLIMAVFVVTVHICSLEEAANPCVAFVHGIARCPVPFFFVISGYFVGKHFGESDWWRRAVVSRFRSLLIPLLLNLVLAFLWSMPFIMIANHLAGRPLAHSIPYIDGIFPGLGPLWYVRCLFALVVLSSIFKWLIDKLGGLWLVIVGGIYVLLEFILVPNEENQPILALFFSSLGIFAPSGLFYFSVGLWCRMKDLRLENIDIKCLLPVGLGLLALRGLFFANAPMMGHILTTLSIPFVFVGIWSVMLVLKHRSLFRDSFPLYLIHASVAIPVGILSKRLFPQVGFGSFLFKWIAVVALTLVAIKLLRRLFPRFTGIWFGGR